MSRKEFEEHANEHGIYTYPVEVPRPDRLHKSIESVRDLLLWMRGDCDCYEDEGTGTTHQCYSCQLKERAEAVGVCLEVEHKTIHPERTGSLSERIYLELWQKQQERSPGLNHGYGTLELVLTPYRQDTKQGFLGSRPYGYVPPVSQRDAQVAATLMQWLGTNCGGSFVREAERRIDEARKTRREFEHEVRGLEIEFQNGEGPNADIKAFELAEAVAQKHFQPGTKNHENLRNDVFAAIRVATNAE